MCPASPPDRSSNKPRPFWDKELPKEMRDVPHPPKNYFAPSTFDFRDLKKRILSNAHAYYAHRFPDAQRFDLIISSTTPTGRLDGVEYRAALIVYPDPKSRNWTMLYKGHSCRTIEDAAFEVKYWLEEDMSAVFDKMEAGDTWAAAATTIAGKMSQDGVSGKETESTADDGEMVDVQTTKGTSKSIETAAAEKGDGRDKIDKGNDKEIPKLLVTSTYDYQVGVTSNAAIPFRKRKSAAWEEEDRKKSMKNDEEERVFVGGKMDLPVQEERKSLVEHVPVPDEEVVLGATPP